MEFFSNLKAIKEMTNLRNGGTATLSISQITNFIINLSDAQKNLSKTQYSAIYSLYKEMSKCKTKIEMDMNEYLKTAINIIEKFDALAPYEKYSGGNEMEYSFLMDELRKRKNTNSNLDVCLDDEDKEYVRYIVNQSLGVLTEKDAINFIKVLQNYQKYGKIGALSQFNIIAKDIIIEKPMNKSLPTISFLSGLLQANNILSEHESNYLTQKYTNLILNLNNIKG